MPRKTKEEAEKTRAAILRAAETAFYERGVVSTSLQEIAKAAGVTRGAVYWHFRDKADLLRALADDVFMPHEEMMSRLAETDLSDPLEALCDTCCAGLNAIANDPHRRRVITILLQRCEYIEEMQPLIQRNDVCRDKIRTRLTSVLAQAQKKNQLTPSWTPATAALTLQHLSYGFIMGEMDYPAPSRARDKARNEAIGAFFGALGA